MHICSRKCYSWEDYVTKKCDDEEVAHMGEFVEHTSRGKFYLRTT
jgi:hypothetical protein